MFVSDNRLETSKKYFFDRLNHQFSVIALQQMWKQLICKRFNWSSADFLFNNNYSLSESDLLYVRDYVIRLTAQEPFQYILGVTDFFGLEIRCDSSALIPRPETEELVNWIRSTTLPTSILDIGTGTGCISLALKSIFPKADIEAWDVSPEALLLAKRNADRLDLAVEFKLIDVLEVQKIKNKFDVIVSNPPYIACEERSDLAKNVIDFEPHVALFVDNEDPLLFYKKIADLAWASLKKGACLFFETHHKFHRELFEEMKRRGYIHIELRKDLQGLDRFLKAQKP